MTAGSRSRLHATNGAARQRRSAMPAQITSTTPNGHAPEAKP